MSQRNLIYIVGAIIIVVVVIYFVRTQHRPQAEAQSRDLSHAHDHPALGDVARCHRRAA